VKADARKIREDHAAMCATYWTAHFSEATRSDKSLELQLEVLLEFITTKQALAWMGGVMSLSGAPAEQSRPWEQTQSPFKTNLWTFGSQNNSSS
jgi:hypothetical protein